MTFAKIRILFYQFQQLYLIELSEQCFTCNIILTNALISLAGNMLINSILNIMFYFNCALYQI